MRPMRSLRLRVADAADRALGRRDPLTPPRRRLDFVGDSDFQVTGEEFLGYFRELADFKPTDRVLDVGCGIGRMARVLAAELRPPGSYDGFDIVADAISWCARHYRDTPVPFAFAHADLHNTRYNPAGRCSAAEYRFPYEDEAFDLVIATSVFTHLLSDEADNYLREVARVLRAGGRMFATWLLLEPQRPPSGLAGQPARPDTSMLPRSSSCLAGQPARPEGRVAPPATRPAVSARPAFSAARPAFSAARPAFAFSHPLGPAFVADPGIPQAAVGYPERWLRERLEARGLRLREPMHWGSWRGTSGLSFQDIVVADGVSARE